MWYKGYDTGLTRCWHPVKSRLVAWRSPQAHPAMGWERSKHWGCSSGKKRANIYIYIYYKWIKINGNQTCRDRRKWKKNTHSNLPSWSPIFWTGSSSFLHTHSQASSLSISRWNMSQTMDIIWLPGLVNCPITNWKITMLSIGKSTISMVIFHSYVSLPEGIFTNLLAKKTHLSKAGDLNPSRFLLP